MTAAPTPATDAVDDAAADAPDGAAASDADDGGSPEGSNPAGTVGGVIGGQQPEVPAASEGRPAGAGSDRPPVVTPVGDDLGRDQDSLATDADAGALPDGFAAAGEVEGNPETAVEGGRLPRGINLPASAAVAPAARPDPLAAAEIDFTGFAIVDLFWRRWDSGEDDFTFRPRQLELGLEASYGDVARVHVDTQLLFTDLETLDGVAMEKVIFDYFIEQVYVEWTPDFAWTPPELTLRVGKFEAPGGGEALDPMDRTPLSRSTTAIRAGPDLLTGMLLSGRLLDVGDTLQLDLFLVWCNGWDRAITDTAARTFNFGVPHRLFKRGPDDWYYEGKLSFMVGVEDATRDDARWFIDYAVSLHLLDFLWLHGELIAGEEVNAGYNPATDSFDASQPAYWLGALATVELRSADFPLSGALRVEYIHDRDLLIGLPTDPDLPNELTTLLGFSATVRFALLSGDPVKVDLALEYRPEFEKGDVPGVGIHRNYDLDKLHLWYSTQQVSLALAGRF